jgi:carbon-monoxide dehydrogenase medium subunit
MTVDYLYPESVEEALECLKAHDGRARVIAGGTDVLPDLRKGKIAPACLVDVTRIPDLARIEVTDDTVTVGAAVTFAAIREHPFLNERIHALVEAARSVGAAAIQNAATWVGNIVQGMPAADGAIVAVALDAEAHIVDQHGVRWQPVESLFEGPGVSAVDPTRQIVTAIRFPRPDSQTGTAWQRIGRRSALVLPILNCAVQVCLAPESSPDPGQGQTRARITQATVALGPVAPQPRRMRQAESFLSGRVPTVSVVAKAADLAAGEARPRTSVMRASRDYRLKIIPILVTDALNAAIDRAAAERYEKGRE